MLGSVFGKSLWDARRSLLGWTVAIVAVGAMYGAFWPSMQSPEMAKALEAYPQAVLEALNYTDMTNAAGYLGGTVFGLLGPLLLAVYAISAGTRTVAGDEDAGTLDLVLAHPVSRQRLALHRMAALTVSVVVICVALWLAMLALAGPADFAGITVGEFAAASLQLALFGLFFGALAFAIGAATGSRALALWLSAGVAVFAYIANGVLPQVDGLEWSRNLSPVYWYLGGAPLSHGLQVGDSVLLLGSSAVLVALGTLLFNRRDVAV